MNRERRRTGDARPLETLRSRSTQDWLCAGFVPTSLTVPISHWFANLSRGAVGSAAPTLNVQGDMTCDDKALYCWHSPPFWPRSPPSHRLPPRGQTVTWPCVRPRERCARQLSI